MLKETEFTLHICDDWIGVDLPDQHHVQTVCHLLEVQSSWIEIIPGLQSLAVQFDPAQIFAEEAAQLLRSSIKNVDSDVPTSAKTVTIPVCHDEDFAPDLAMVAEKIGIAPSDFASWHADQGYRVVLIGFMPGFAYLRSDTAITGLKRLKRPRQLIPSGSIGMIETQACIYPFSSPGGWPIIGKTPEHLFNPEQSNPALLAAGDNIKFQSISRREYEQFVPRSSTL